ncbi:DoxX family protein [Streptomyces sp. NPDC088097]|uniref:DoxX family protein n=1 Tax=Streptomyces sp. NPDC088097 TaxID=3365823 RepID=UPI0038267282
MTTTATVVTLVAAFMAAFSGAAIFLRSGFVVEPLAQYGVPRSWWNPLGAAKTAGAAGLIAGFFLPYVGAAAAIGLVLYFSGAVITIVRARSYAHIPFPLIYAAPAAAALLLA